MDRPRRLLRKRWVMLLPALLLLAGCTFVISPTAATPAAGEETPTEEPTTEGIPTSDATPEAIEEITGTEDITGVEEITGAEGITGTGDVTGTGEITESRDITGTGASTGEGDFVVGEAMVDSIDVLTLESFPVQIHVHVVGNLPDGCTELQEPVVTQTGNTFTVDLPTIRPTDAMCTQALVPYEITVPLDVEGLAAGEYTVEVNGVTGSFTLETDNQ
ncbi:MAG TPA: hypothetical protein VNK95_10930 [Caldilineaceae bacterium]|nr:hypothetical protein [Caldilineaceae bacterium]